MACLALCPTHGMLVRHDHRQGRALGRLERETDSLAFVTLCTVALRSNLVTVQRVYSGFPSAETMSHDAPAAAPPTAVVERAPYA